MTVQYSTAVRNALGDAWSAAIGSGAIIELWSGLPPANCAAAATGVKLARFNLASSWSPAAAGGVKTLSSLPIATTAIASGTAGYYRFLANDDATCHEQGTVGQQQSDMTIDNPAIVNGQAVQITGYSKTYPGA